MSFIASIFSGGLFGFLGNIVKQHQKTKELKIKLDHEAVMVAARSKATIDEAAANLKIEEEVTDRVIETGNAAAFVESMKLGNEKALDSQSLHLMLTDETKWGLCFRPLAYLLLTLMGLTDVIRRNIRPGVTIGSLSFAGYVLFYAFKMFQFKGGFSNIPDKALLEILIIPIIDLFLFTASTAVGWWFADRQMAKDYRATIGR